MKVFFKLTTAFIICLSTFPSILLTVDSRHHTNIISNQTFAEEKKNPLTIEKIIGLSDQPGTFQMVAPSGWALDPVNQQGLVVASNGTIYLGDNAEGQIEMFSKDLKSIGNFGSLGTGEKQFQYITSLAIDDQDQIYVLDSYLATIQIFKKDGTFIRRFGERGEAQNQLKTPTDIYVLKSGEILVADYNKGVKVFSNEGVYIKEFSNDQNLQIKEGMHPNQITTDANGYVYISLYNQNTYEYSIVKYDLQGVFINTSLKRNTDEDMKYAEFKGIETTGNYIYILCFSYKPTIRKYEILSDPTKPFKFIDIITKAPENKTKNINQNEVLWPTSLFCKNENIYCIDAQFNRIVIFNKKKEMIGFAQSSIMMSRWLYEKYEKKPLPLGFFRNPQGVRFDSIGRMYVANSGFSYVSVFDPSGKPLANIGTTPKSTEINLPGELYTPTDINFDEAGNFYVTDRDLRVIQIFNSDLKPVSSNKLKFKNPQGIVFDSNQRLLVVNSDPPTISALENDSNLITKYKQVDQYPIDGKWPVGIDVLENDNMVTCITLSDTIQILNPRGELLKKIGETGTKPGQLGGPQGVCVDSSGNIYVAETGNGRIQKFSPDGSLIWCSELNWMGLSFITQDKEGKLYVTDCTHGVVLVISDSTSVPPKPKKTKPINPAGSFDLTVKNNATIREGDIITLQIKTDEIIKAETFNFCLQYPSENILFQSTQLGQSLRNNDFQLTPSKIQGNTVTINATSLDGSNHPGSGILFEIDFLAKTLGSVTIKFDKIVNQNAIGFVIPPKTKKDFSFTIEPKDITPPLLNVHPIPSFVYESVLWISGITEESALVTVNNNSIPLEKDGSFQTQITLQKGNNVIEIIASDLGGNQSKYKKAVTLEEHVTIKLIIGTPVIVVNGHPTILDTEPFIDKKTGRTFVPILAIATGLHAIVDYESKERKITIIKGEIEIAIWIGKPKGQVNGKEINIDSQKLISPLVIKERTFVPLRFIGENLRCKIEWDPKTQVITLIQ